MDPDSISFGQCKKENVVPKGLRYVAKADYLKKGADKASKEAVKEAIRWQHRRLRICEGKIMFWQGKLNSESQDTVDAPTERRGTT